MENYSKLLTVTTVAVVIHRVFISASPSAELFISSYLVSIATVGGSCSADFTDEETESLRG